MTNNKDIENQKVVNLGRIQSPKGILGEMRVTCFGSLLSMMPVNSALDLYECESTQDGFLINPRRHSKQILISAKWIGNRLILLKLKDIADRDRAEKLKSLYLGITLSEAKKKFSAKESDYYLFHLIDLIVKDSQTQNVEGSVESLEQSGSQVWLNVYLIKEKETIMVPLESPYVDKINFEKGEILTTGIRELIA
ncbi:MAG: ribosome maturation factor RimM [Spirochaetia bacterium]|nr:ribosome maturation factor RimM [Spirochaetia bacterium]